jgi:hypothetical protein
MKFLIFTFFCTSISYLLLLKQKTHKLLLINKLLIICFLIPTIAAANPYQEEWLELQEKVHDLEAIVQTTQQRKQEMEGSFSFKVFNPFSYKRKIRLQKYKLSKLARDIKRVIEEMDDIKTKSKVSIYRNIDDTLINVYINPFDDEVRECSFASKDGHLFESESVVRLYEQYQEMYKGLSQGYGQHIPYIKRCIKHVPENDLGVYVNNKRKSLCRKSTNGGGDLHQNLNHKYFLERKDGRIILTSSINFKYRGRPENKEEVESKAAGSVNCIRSFFALHGIDLNLTFSFNKTSSHRQSKPYESDVNLWDHYHRSNSKNWSTLSRFGKPMDQDRRCSLYIHELGHVLGLPDTYMETKKCPDRMNIKPNSNVMNDHEGLYDHEEIKHFDEEQIKMLLSPLCDAEYSRE